MHRLLRKNIETVALAVTLIAVLAPFIALWHLVIEPHRPGMWLRLAMSGAATVLMVLLSGPVERQIQQRMDRRKAATAPTKKTEGAT